MIKAAFLDVLMVVDAAVLSVSGVAACFVFVVVDPRWCRLDVAVLSVDPHL
jgi:hypothetical protein